MDRSMNRMMERSRTGSSSRRSRTRRRKRSISRTGTVGERVSGGLGVVA